MQADDGRKTKSPIVGYTGKLHIATDSDKLKTDPKALEDALYFKSFRPSPVNGDTRPGTSNSTIQSLSPSHSNSAGSMGFSRASSPSRTKHPNLFELSAEEDKRTRKQPILGYEGMYVEKGVGKVGRIGHHYGDSISSPDLFKPEGVPIPKEIDPLPRGGTAFETAISPASVENIRLRPISGYTGSFRGKIVGNLGRASRHYAALSSFDGDDVRNLLGDGVDNLVNEIET